MYHIPEHISAITSLCSARATWAHQPPNKFYQQDAIYPHMLFSDVIGTTEMIRYIWHNCRCLHEYFSHGNIRMEDLMNNPYISNTLIRWPHDLVSIPHILCIWDNVAYKGHHIHFNHLKWFTSTLRNTCLDLINGRRIFKPRAGYCPKHTSFGDDTVNDMTAWKYWVIVSLYPPAPFPERWEPETSTEVRSEQAMVEVKSEGALPPPPIEEPVTAPVTAPAPAPADDATKPQKKDMKKKFRKLLEYKLCDASDELKADVYAQLIETLNKVT